MLTIIVILYQNDVWNEEYGYNFFRKFTNSNSQRNDRHFVFRKQCFHFSKLKFPSNFQEGNLRMDFSCLIRTLNLSLLCRKHEEITTWKRGHCSENTINSTVYWSMVLLRVPAHRTRNSGLPMAKSTRYFRNGRQKTNLNCQVKIWQVKFWDIFYFICFTSPFWQFNE